MILRRAKDLLTTDNVRLDDVLWNIERVSVGDVYVVVRLSRMAGEQRLLELFTSDLVQLA